MEKETDITNRISEQTQTLSRNQKSSTEITAKIPPEQHAALFSVINKTRKLNGWGSKTATELHEQILTWAEFFDHQKIPKDPVIYNALYLACSSLRADAIGRGEDPPTIDGTYLASQWPSVRVEIEARRVAAGRTLTENAASVCKHCNGSGWRQVTQGGAKGVKKCDHQDYQPEMI